MTTETRGIVLRQTKTVRNRQMVLLFTEQYGKISAGTFAEGGGKRKSELALRPFSLGRYELRQAGEYWHINRSETLRDHYGLGADVDKYLAACYALELTDKLLPDEGAASDLFGQLVCYLGMLEERASRYGVLTVAYTVKALQAAGQEPLLTVCARCGRTDGLTALEATAGGAICDECRRGMPNERLIYESGFDIVKLLKFMADHPLERLRGLALEETALTRLQAYLRLHLAAHLDIGELKSDAGRCGI